MKATISGLGERKLAADAILRGEERFRLLMSGITDYAILMLDPHGFVVSWSEGAERIKGYRAEEIIGQHFSRFYLPEEVASDKPSRELETAANEGRFEEDGWRVRKDGSRFMANVIITVLRNATGQILGYRKITRDITDRKTADAVFVRSEKLAAVGRLATSMAHEINNPLAAVTNLLYLARGHVHAPEVQELLDTAERELRRVSIVANQTMRFHSQSSKPQLISSESLFETVLSTYDGRLRNSNVRVEKRGFSEQPIECFEEDMRQVLANVIGNAVDAMPRGGRLVVRSRAGTDWKSRRTGHFLTIADTGTGMSPDSLTNLFEAFFTTKEIGGIGLGLWIGAEIMKRHQGFIRLRSSQRAENRGTVVTLFVPLSILKWRSPTGKEPMEKLEQVTRAARSRQPT